MGLRAWSTVARLPIPLGRAWRGLAGRLFAGAWKRRASEERLRAIVEACADGVVVLDAAGRILLVNAAVEGILGVPRQRIVGRGYRDLGPFITTPAGDPILDLGERFERAMRTPGSGHPRDFALGRPDGTRAIVSANVAALRETDGLVSGLVVTLHDVTAERMLATQREVRLTDVRRVASAAAAEPSATAAGERLLAEFSRFWPVVSVAVYAFDADGAHRLVSWGGAAAPGQPAILGRPQADRLRLLCSVARPLRASCEEVTVGGEPGRVIGAGGGRATVIVPLSNEAGLVGALVAAESREATPLEPDEERSLADFGQIVAAVVRRAQADELAEQRRARERIGQVLDRPELLRPVFQPILSLANGRITGYEALARFVTEPLQSPDLWFAQALRAGLGAELQALAILRARQLADATGLPRGTFLSVNVSPHLLADPRVESALGIEDLRRTVIELTEEEVVSDYSALRAATAPYRAHGARFAVDDAGAGYASMQHVTELRPDFIKLGARLITGLRDDVARQALLRALQGFSEEIGATLIAEGVESPDDLVLLTVTRLPILAQGYAIARPAGPWPELEKTALDAWRRARRSRRAAMPRLADAVEPAAARSLVS